MEILVPPPRNLGTACGVCPANTYEASSVAGSGMKYLRERVRGAS